MENEKKVLLSGIQPSGELHLGNYLGAIKNWAELSDQFDCYWFMADLHTITVRQDPAALRKRTLAQIATYIACGLDPEKNTIFVQSHVSAHAELGWVLDCYTMFGELSRMTQFKDKSARNADNINAGLFTYPCLMAADIRKFKRAVTDSDTERCVRLDRENKPGVANLMGIYSAVTGKSFEAIEAEFEGKGYGVLKPAVGEAVVETLRPIREETERLLADKAYLESVYRAGAERASRAAEKTLRKVYKKVGFLPR